MRDAKGKTKQFSQALCRTALAMAIGMCLPVATSMAQDTEATVTYNIPAGDLAGALDKFSTQSGIQLLYKPDLVAGKRGREVSGAQSPAAALKQLLGGTGLIWERANATTYVLKSAPAPPPKAAPKQTPAATEGAASKKEVTELPEILVTGKRSLNTDIERTRDDVQPYVIFDRQQIERSGAISVDDFLKQRLTMNTQVRSDNQTPSNGGNRSNINLRGLGTNQTLILIDGRRTGNINFRGTQQLQADLNGIPLAAVERIEVLPTTASGIYGGDATGGVINVILRRDYQGSEVSLTWDNTFDTDSAQTRVDFATGFNLGTDTNVMLTASRSEGNALLRRDRDFVEAYRRQAYANNPALYLPPASAPLGHLTNFRSTDGAELVLDDGTLLGSSFAHVPAGYLGAGSDGGAALLSTAGRYDLGLANSGQAGRRALLNTPEISSANATIRHTFTPKVEGFLELGASNNTSRFAYNLLPNSFTLPADAPTNPFQQDLQVTAPLPTQDIGRSTRNTERRVAAGLIVRLPGEWLGEVDYVWHRSTNSSSEAATIAALTPAAQAAVENGSLDILRDPNVAPLDLTPYLIRPGRIDGPHETTTRNPTLLLGGPVGTLPGGRPMLSLRLEQRDEAFAQAATLVSSSATTLIYPSKSQTVDSAFAELRLPLFSGLNARPGLQELEVQLAARHDRYTIEGATGFIFSPDDPVTQVENRLSSSNFTAGFRWRPLESLVLRASYGTGFLPPSVNQLAPNPPFIDDRLVLDPRRGNTPMGPREIIDGGNPDLQPEESKNLSFGLVLTPSLVRDLRLSVDYVRIEKTDNISGISLLQLLALEDRFPDRVVRGPNLSGDPAGWAGPVRLLDGSLINIARAEVEAIDMQLDWSRETANWGRFEVFAAATWQTHFKTRTFDDQPVIENVGFLESPPKLKANLGATWQYRNWTLGWVARYFDAYRPYPSVFQQFPELIPDLLITQGSDRVEHQIYHDLTAQYQFDGRGWLGAWGEGLSLQLGIRNVFDKAPPRELETYSTYGDPRMASYWLTLRKSFN